MAKALSKWASFRGKRAFKTPTRMEFYEQVSSFLDGGIPLGDVLEKLAENYRKASPNNALLVVLDDIISGMSDGQPMSEALSRWAPASETMLIRAGEAGGTPADAFRNAQMTTGAGKEMSSTLISGLSYPGVLMVVLMGLIYVFSVFAVPTLVSIKDPSQWPAIAKPLYGMSVFVENYWWVALAIIISLVVASTQSLPRYKGAARPFLDKIPPYSFYRAFQSSVTLISISSLMKAGIPLVDAVESLASQSRGYVAHHLKIMLVRLGAGRSTGDAFDTGFFSEHSIRNIRVYSELSTIHSSMERIGKTSVAGGVATIKALSGALSMLTIISIAMYVAWVYLSFFILMQQVGSEVGGF